MLKLTGNCEKMLLAFKNVTRVYLLLVRPQTDPGSVETVIKFSGF